MSYFDDMTFGHDMTGAGSGLMDHSMGHGMGHVSMDDFIQKATSAFGLSDDVISGSVHDASSFFSLPDLPVIMDDAYVCNHVNNMFTTADDMVGVNRGELLRGDVHDKTTLTQIMVHELGHSIGQTAEATGQLTRWADELFSDTFVSLYAKMHGEDTTGFYDFLRHGVTYDTPSHPGIDLRERANTYGEKILEIHHENGMPLTWQSVLDCFHDVIKDDWPEISRREAEANALAQQKANAHPGASISFGNMYDDNTAQFLEDCRKAGFELPLQVDTSSDRSSSVVERDRNGGLLSIDKVLIEHKLTNDLAAGKITQEQYDQLKSQMGRC